MSTRSRTPDTLADRMIRSWRRPVASASSADRIADWSIASIITSRASSGSARPGVGVHQLGQDRLVERSPVDADPDRHVVVDGDPDDRREMLVVALGADVARVDPVLGEGRGHLRVLGQQLVAVVVEVADDRHVDAEAADLADHLGHRGRRLLRVDRHPHRAASPRAPAGRPGSRSRPGRPCRCWSSTARRSDGALPTSTPPTSTLTVGRRRGRRSTAAVTSRRRGSGRCRSP